MHISEPPIDHAVEQLLENDREDWGYVRNLTRVWAWRPEVSRAFEELNSTLQEGSLLKERDWAVLACALASEYGDSYGSLVWGTRLAGVATTEVAKAVLGGWGSDVLSERDFALAEWARSAVSNSNWTRSEDLALLRMAGLNDREIFEATTFLGFQLAYNTIHAALGARPDWQLTVNAHPSVRQCVAYGRAPDLKPTERLEAEELPGASDS